MRRPWPLVLLFLTAVLSPLNGTTLFEETLASHTSFPATPSSARWASRPVDCVLSAPDVFGDGSAYIQLAGAGRYLRSIPVSGLPQLATLTFRYHEPASATHALKFGWIKSGQTDLNSAGAFLRFELNQGLIVLSSLNGATASATGAASYPRDRALVLAVVLNLGAAEIPDYAGGRTLPARSADLWVLDPALNTAAHALTVSLAAALGVPDQICFRSFSADTGVLSRLDDIRVVSGAVLPDFTTPAADGFVHPGVFQTQAALELMRARVSGLAEHPMKEGWAVLRADPRSSLAYSPQAYAQVDFAPSGTTFTETRIRDDAHAAYAHALQWVVTGDPAHAAKARQILDLWASTLVSFTSTGSPSTQTELECAWLVPKFAAAAEIIRHFDQGSAAWPAADIQRFTVFLDLLANEAAKSVDRDHNWGASAVLAQLARAVFKGDRAAYDAACVKWRARLVAIFPLDLNQSLEITRDNFHVQYSLMALVQGAEIARRQGDDLYGTLLDGQTTPRLALALEHFAKLFLGVSPSPSPAFAYLNAGVGFTAYEMAHAHYNVRSGLALPHFAAFVEAQIRPDPRYLLFASWSTLTHGEPVAIAPLAAPTGFFAQTSPGRVDLAWADRAGAESGYEIERREGAGAWNVLAHLPADSIHHADTTVSPATEYSYRVRPVGSDGAVGDWSDTRTIVSDGPVISPAEPMLTLPVGEIHEGIVTLRNPASVPQTFALYPPAASTGYPYRLSAQPGGPAYVWDGIAYTAGAVSAPAGDEAFATAQLGFSFPFFGQTHTSLRICTNGFVTFAAGADTRPYNQNIPSATNAPPSSIFLFWADLLTEDDGRIWHRSMDEDGDGAADVFVVEYDRVRLFGNVDRVSAQLRLVRDGRILMYFRNIPGGSRYTVGLQNADGTVASRLAYSNFLGEVSGVPVVSGLAARFDPPLAWLGAPATTLGPVAPGASIAFTLRFDTSGLAPGAGYVAELVAVGSAAHQPPISLPVRLTIGVPSAYQSWKLDALGDAFAEDLADPDRDGLPHLLEYALGADPLVPASATQVHGSNNSGRLCLEFSRVADPALAYAVEASVNLVNWSVIWTSTGAQNVPGPVVVNDLADLDPAQPRRFLRLRVTR